MNKKMFTFSLILAFAMVFPSSIKSDTTINDTKVYIFGVATCYKDSTTYLTQITTLENANLRPKTDLLINDYLYSNELKIFIIRNVSKNVHPIVSLFYDTDKEKLEKAYIKTKKRILDKQYFKLKNIDIDTFKFKEQIQEN